MVGGQVDFLSLRRTYDPVWALSTCGDANEIKKPAHIRLSIHCLAFFFWLTVLGIPNRGDPFVRGQATRPDKRLHAVSVDLELRAKKVPNSVSRTVWYDLWHFAAVGVGGPLGRRKLAELAG